MKTRSDEVQRVRSANGHQPTDIEACKNVLSGLAVSKKTDKDGLFPGVLIKCWPIVVVEPEMVVLCAS